MTNHHHNLPVQYSIVDSEALERLIETLYGWTDVHCQLIKGTMRDVYEVKVTVTVNAPEQRAILTLYRHGERSAQDIEAECAVMTHLSLSGLHVPTPILQTDHQIVFSLLQPEGERFAAMTTFQEGTPIGRQITAEMAQRVGTLIGEAHCALDTLVQPVQRPVLDFQEAIWQALVSIAQAAPHRSEDLAWLLDLRIRLDTDISVLSHDNASYGLIHGDVIPSNILSQSSHLALLDFDLCAYGWRVYDVASFLVEITWWDMGDDVRDAFLSAYHAVCPMSQEEIDGLPAVQAVRSLLLMGLAARHVNTWGRIYFSDASIDKSLKMIRDVFPF